MTARERQLERAHEDVQRAKQMIEEMRGKMAEVQKTKDEGWKELNARVARARSAARGHLRAGAHPRGAQGRPDVARDGGQGHARREGAHRCARSSQLKNERDELRDKVIRQNHQVEALEEEQRRLARMLSDGGGGGGGGGDNGEHVRLATEVRELKVELRKVETERTRFAERLETAERERAQLDEQLRQARRRSRLGDAVEGHHGRGARAARGEAGARPRRRGPRRKRRWPRPTKARETATQAADRAMSTPTARTSARPSSSWS